VADFSTSDTVVMVSTEASGSNVARHPVELSSPGESGCDICTPAFGTSHHPQVHLMMAERGWVSCVDAGIAPLVAELWSVGVRTQYSCERMETDRAYVLFPTARDVSTLLEIIRQHASQELFDRVTDDTTEGWNFDVAMPMSVVANDETVGVGDTAIRIAASFPSTDIQILTSLLASLRGGDALVFPAVRAEASELPPRMPAGVLSAVKALEAARRDLQQALNAEERNQL
jgi:hypothetical protein